MEHALQSRPRIEVVDALRGFAVMAIILLHNIEHFNLYNFPEATTDFMKALDKGVWDTLFFLFSGKAYAIFALLFGFSFFIQFDNQARKGRTSASFLLAVGAPILYRLLQRIVLPGGDLGALFDLGYRVDTGLQVE